MLDINHNADYAPEENAVNSIERLREAGEPIILTVNGKVTFAVQDEESYQKLLDLIDRLETIEAVKIGLEEMERGETRSFEEFDREMRLKYGISR